MAEETKVLVFFKGRGCRKPIVQGSGCVPSTILDAVLWSRRDHCNRVYIVECTSAKNGRDKLADLQKNPRWFADTFSCEPCGWPNIFIVGSKAQACAEAYDSIFRQTSADPARSRESFPINQGLFVTSAAAVRRDIKADWPNIVRRSGVNPAAVDWLPKTPKLFGGSTKTELSRSFGVLTAVAYLSPADESGVDNCPNRTRNCTLACLGHAAGRMIMAPNKRARIWKTALYHGARDLFRELADLEISALAVKAVSKGLTPAVRFDGSTDLGEGLKSSVRNPYAIHYDYTKNPRRALQNARTRPENYRLVFSFSGENLADSIEVLSQGGNTAVVFDTKKGEPLPETWHGFPVLDGDIHDFRAMDPRGYVVGLRIKAARNRAESIEAAGCFVVRVQSDLPMVQSA